MAVAKTKTKSQCEGIHLHYNQLDCVRYVRDTHNKFLLQGRRDLIRDGCCFFTSVPTILTVKSAMLLCQPLILLMNSTSVA